jgi:pimeloyl-ACP methyl ester carboxylesterase
MTSSSEMLKQDDLGENGFADSGGVKIHYVTEGTGPLVVLVHGIPGFWYDFRNQMPALAEHFQVVAIDQRGFNLSDQPSVCDRGSFVHRPRQLTPRPGSNRTFS